MEIEIKSIKDPGLLKDERLIIKIMRECNIGSYLVFDTIYVKDKSVANVVRNPYWFPDKEVKAGDLVIVYTKSGKSSVKDNMNGSQSHFFYRDLDSPVWSDENDCAVVLEISSWASKGRGE